MEAKGRRSYNEIKPLPAAWITIRRLCSFVKRSKELLTSQSLFAVRLGEIAQRGPIEGRDGCDKSRIGGEGHRLRTGFEVSMSAMKLKIRAS